ncbi:hypothetical protein [Sphingobium sp. MI1205]|uniref:hypothetical protein n=1 Tax=Sphingobium sp. MI1205 TaxID=407020 RepID=UPI0007703406|nr:hypothetical protein [Sphingobium sp. MI1205]AMK18933.1 hypothetical protein K663_12765 [Sphingobium sp. MI1205]
MKVCIVIQSDAFRASAGMRIRYDRFREFIADPDVTLDAIACEHLATAEKLDHDVYVFCKTFDTMALLLARRVVRAGKIVGQDLFDDYFSQITDPRLERFREWLRDMAPVTNFALCSTPRMVEVVRNYLPGIPIVAIDDPIMGYDPFMVAALADLKTQRARMSRILNIVWFGIGDNPYFPVGLMDLASCEPVLARLERLGWHVKLRIVTNRRPFDSGDAEVLRALGVAYEVVEWTEKAEQDALTEATVAILPVNGQSFSRAKSLNRAITALNRGCHVLSIGYPLYDRLNDYIYRSEEEMSADILSGNSKMRGDRIQGLTATLSQFANPLHATETFFQQARASLNSLPPLQSEAPLLCLLHGHVTTINLHKMASSLDGVSVSTIFTNKSWNFPVRFDRVSNEIQMRMTASLAERFSVPLQNTGQIRIADLDLVEVDLVALGHPPLKVNIPQNATALQTLPLYPDIMTFARDCCRSAFGRVDVLISDTMSLRRPFSSAAALAS